MINFIIGCVSLATGLFLISLMIGIGWFVIMLFLGGIFVAFSWIKDKVTGVAKTKRYEKKNIKG